MKTKSLRIFLVMMLVLQLIFTSFTPAMADAKENDKIELNEILYSEDFQDSSLEEWTLTGANDSWSIQEIEGNKVLHQKIPEEEAIATVNHLQAKDMVVQAKVQTSDEGFPGIIARYDDSMKYYMLRINPDNKLELIKTDQSSHHVLASKDIQFEKEKWYELKMVLYEDSIIGYLDDVRILEANDHTYTSGKIGFRSKWGNVSFDDLLVRELSTIPETPTNIETTLTTTSSIRLEWTSSENTSQYRLYRSSKETGELKEIYRGKETSYTDKSVQPNTDYYYTITADDHGIESKMSDVYKVTTKDLQPAPTNLTISEKTDTTVTLQWTEVAGATKYQIYRSLNQESDFENIYSGNELEFKDTGLKSGYTYYYKLSYFNDQEESHHSEVVQAKTDIELPESEDELSGLIAAYKFDENNGNIANDSSGNDKMATLKNGTTWVEGRKDGAVQLDGVNQYIELPKGIVSELDEMTISTWVKVDDVKSWSRIFDFGSGTNKNIFLSPQSGENDTRFVMKNGGEEERLNIAPSQIKTNEWVHYAITLNGKTGIMYINGEEVARSHEFTLKPKDLGMTTSNFIGKSQYDVDPYLNAAIDDFYIFNRALSAAEVALMTTDENKANVEKDTKALDLGDVSGVIKDIQLPVQGKNLSTIIWKSSNQAVIQTDGKVTRPKHGEGHAEVELTATITQGNASETKVFTVTVLEEFSDQDAVQEDIDNIVLLNQDGVTAKLDLPTIGDNQTTIHWESTNERYIRSDGMVSRPQVGEGDEIVTLTATVSKGEYTQNKKFEITVLEQDETSAYLFAYDKVVDGEKKLHYAVSRDGRNWIELGHQSNIVQPIDGGKVIKQRSADIWYKYEFLDNHWTVYQANEPTGQFVESDHSFTLPTGALDGQIKPITEEEWIAYVHQLSEMTTKEVAVISTEKGKKPKLPELVRFVYKNHGQYIMTEVEWDKVDPKLYSEIGTFTVSGKIKGYDEIVNAKIEVIDNPTVDVIKNGEFWYDTDGAMIQAHGGDIIQVDDTYYWFGEDKAHNGATLKGVNVYASKDLKNWEFRNSVINPTSHPELAESKIERPKVIYNEKTKKFILWGHWEEAHNYNQGNVVVAVSDTVDGDYEYVYRFQPLGHASRDFTVFQDDDGEAYLFSSTRNNYDMNVYRLTDDYLYVEELLYTLFPGQHREAPAITKKDGVYYYFTSGASGWYPNQGKYAFTEDITTENGWSELKNFGNPSTYYTQPAFMFTVKGTEEDTFMYVGDRWNPSALRESQYIWLPLELENGNVGVDYYKTFNLDMKTGVANIQSDRLISKNKLATSNKGENPTAANDGNEQNYFEFGGDLPVTWTVDLENKYDLSRIDLSWRQYNGSEVYVQYTIEGSNDGENFELLADMSKNKTPSFQSLDLSGTYQYVRVNILGQYGHSNNADRPVTWYTGLHEVKIFEENEETEDEEIHISTVLSKLRTYESEIPQVTYRMLQAQLEAIQLYEKNDEATKQLKHTKNLLKILQLQFQNNQLPEHVYLDLYNDVEKYLAEIEK